MTFPRAAFAAVAIAVGLATPALAEDWNMPTPYPDATFHTQNIREFAEDVAEKTNGELTITVHSASSLIKHGEIKNAVRSGQVPIGEFFLSTLANEDAAFGVDSEPFVATSYEDAEKMWQAQKPVITKLLEKQRLMPLFSVPWPPQGLYTTTEIKSVDDLKGLKFRAYNAPLEKFASIAGAAPVQVEVPEIPQAFSVGAVEAMMTSPSTGANGKAWDYVSYYSPINAWVPKNIVVVNKAAFEALDEETRNAVMAAAEAAEARGWEMSKKETDAKTQELKDNGMTVVEPSAELVDGLKEIGAQMQESWNAEASEEAKAIMNEYNQ
ncbi:TRAP transporter substrate-binding protein [Notoacmeibacter ruber]|uniref:C4-dicarboxylate ABC transporter substrate-binding protein n=1 Tax=Notoacmeibacter ruber TaxID=2670375 RepID=A0A3L7JHH9_9HYPH|nr:TRAP transporter substrate-binding protein [Notoacmeibacter ruber]RLQ89629.1 C4-dicarboxylate ABC transporter substrate-binding protein [Notoacmeibacter ruber]